MQSLYKTRVKNEVKAHNVVNSDLNMLKKEEYIFDPQASSIATLFQTPLTPAITDPSCTPARNSVSVRLAKPGLAAMSSMACATSTPWIGPSVLFQVQKLVRPSSFRPTSRPVLPKKEYTYQAEDQSMVKSRSCSAAISVIRFMLCMSSSEK